MCSFVFSCATAIEMREFAEGLAGDESCDASRMSFVIDHEFLRDCG